MKERDRLLLALETGLSTKTVVSWQSGKRVNHSTHIALTAACEKLGIAVPALDSEVNDG